jgi:hypothetical protein
MSPANWWSRLTGAECRECGAPVSAFARVCPYCGAANRARGPALAVVAALGASAVAAVIAIAVVASWQRLPVEQAPADGDFTWLRDAMQECDDVAAKEPDTLHFLVIPLAAAGKTEVDWGSKALNKVGNAVLLRSDVTLEGLQSGTLAIAKDGYILSIRDQAQVVYNWDRSVGVAKFSIPDAAKIDGFNVQFKFRDKTGGDDWGNTFARQKGNCYWVNAILGS